MRELTHTHTCDAERKHKAYTHRHKLKKLRATKTTTTKICTNIYEIIHRIKWFFFHLLCSFACLPRNIPHLKFCCCCFVCLLITVVYDKIGNINIHLPTGWDGDVNVFGLVILVFTVSLTNTHMPLIWRSAFSNNFVCNYGIPDMCFPFGLSQFVLFSVWRIVKVGYEYNVITFKFLRLQYRLRTPTKQKLVAPIAPIFSNAFSTATSQYMYDVNLKWIFKCFCRIKWIFEII